MDDGLSKRPVGVSFNPLSEQVFEVLEKHTAFPWAILAAQAKRQSADPANLTAHELRKLIEPLATGVGRFTSPQKRDQVRELLSALAKRHGA